MKRIYLLDPLNGIKEETTYELLEKITGKSQNYLASIKCKKMKLAVLDKYIVSEDISKEEVYKFMCKEKPKDEIWKDITKGKLTYSISDYGRVKRKFLNGKEKLLRPFIHHGTSRSKYLWIKLFGKRVSLHGLVADTFLEVPEGMVKYHMDGNIYNNRANNIGFCTKKELGNKFGGLAKGEPVVKLDPLTLEELDYYENMEVAAKENFTCRENIRLAVRGKQKTAAGFAWKTDKEFLRS